MKNNTIVVGFCITNIYNLSQHQHVMLLCDCMWMDINNIPSPSDPSNPPAPTELRVANMSFGPGRAASARLQWSMPADLDVPVHHYKVSWSWTAIGQASASSLTKRRKTVREVRTDSNVLRLLYTASLHLILTFF